MNVQELKKTANQVRKNIEPGKKEYRYRCLLR